MLNDDYLVPGLSSPNVIFHSDYNGLLTCITLNSENRSGRPQVESPKLRWKFTVAWRIIMDRAGLEELSDYFFELGAHHRASSTGAFQTLLELNLDRIRLFRFDSFAGFPRGCRKSISIPRLCIWHRLTSQFEMGLVNIFRAGSRAMANLLLPTQAE